MSCKQPGRPRNIEPHRELCLLGPSTFFRHTLGYERRIVSQHNGIFLQVHHLAAVIGTASERVDAGLAGHLDHVQPHLEDTQRGARPDFQRGFAADPQG